MNTLRNPPWVIAIGIVGLLAIGSVVIYYGIVAQMQPSDAVEVAVPSYAEGATTLLVNDMYVGQPSSYALAFRDADVVALGTVTHVQSAKWTTKDEAPPRDVGLETLKDATVQIRTPILMRVDQAFKGTSVGDEIAFSIAGGRVGDTAIVFEGNEDLEVKARVIVFLGEGDIDSPARKAHADGLYLRAHLVVEGDTAKGPLRDVPLRDILDELSEGN